MLVINSGLLNVRFANKNPAHGSLSFYGGPQRAPPQKEGFNKVLLRDINPDQEASFLGGGYVGGKGIDLFGRYWSLSNPFITTAEWTDIDQQSKIHLKFFSAYRKMAVLCFPKSLFPNARSILLVFYLVQFLFNF